MSFPLAELIRSRRLAVALLCSGALLAAAGTIATPGIGGEGRRPAWLPAARFLGIVETQGSPVFLLLIAATGVNLAACTWYRTAPLWRAGSAPAGDRQRLRLMVDAAMHLSLLAIVAGGAGKGLWGSVRTKNIHVGQAVEAFYDFVLDRDVPLGFTLEVLERQDSWYPLRAQIGISDPATGKKLALVEAVEGRAVAVSGSDLDLRLQGADSAVTSVRLIASGGERTATVDLETAAGKSSADFGSHRLTLVAWNRELKRVRGRIACIGTGAPPVVGWVSPQERVTCGGVSFAMTAWGTDPEGNDYIGLQAVRDPAAPLFWGGCVAFTVFLPLFIAVRARGPGARGARARRS